MYAGITRDVALAETVFHDIDPALPGAGVYTDDLDSQILCRVVFERDLRLGDLTAPGLAALGLPDDSLVHGPPTVYGRSAAWALALHQWRRTDEDKRLDGLLWESRLAGPDLCFLLFGDRVPRRRMRSSRHIALDAGHGYGLVSTFADRRGITVYE